VLSEADRERLIERFRARFAAADPASRVRFGNVRASVTVDEGGIDADRALVGASEGITTTTEWDGSLADAEAMVDDAADSIAWDSEGDRWMHGKGWREYRP
jgi:hypothetical protein